MEGEGLEFSKGRMHLSLPAEEGTLNMVSIILLVNSQKKKKRLLIIILQPLYTPKPATSSTGTHATPSAPNAATSPSL
jgi:hypothetical protein